MVAAAVVGSAVVGAVGSGIAGDKQRSSANKAADAQTRAQESANQLQRDMFNANAGLTEFQRGIGNQALEQLGGLYGLQGGYNPAGTVRFGDNGTIEENGPISGSGFGGSLQRFANNLANPADQNAGQNGGIVQSGPGPRPDGQGVHDYSAFYTSPDYQFALQQGELGLGRQQAARGNLFSGGAAKEASRFNQGLATQQFGNYTNRLAQLAGIGTQGTNQLANTLTNTGNQLAQGEQNIGNARASGYINAGNAQAAGINGIAGGFGNALGAYAGGGFGGGGGGNNPNIYTPDAFNIKY